MHESELLQVIRKFSIFLDLLRKYSTQMFKFLSKRNNCLNTTKWSEPIEHMIEYDSWRDTEDNNCVLRASILC